MIPILIKMFPNKVTVVECEKESGGEAVEYDPFHPEERWDANVRWSGENEIIINVGKYSLKAKRKNKNVNVFQGVESGPYGENEIVVFLLDLERATQPRKSEGALRLAKIARHRAVIIDCKADGNGKEYDSFHMNEKWDVSVSWPSNDEIEISTGPYWLKAWRVHDGVGADYFSGIETGPEGNFAFSVYLLSADVKRLNKLPSTEWLIFRAGEEYDRGDNPNNEERWLHPVLRRKGVAWLMFPKSIDKERPNMANCLGYGIRGGKNEEMKIDHFPTDDKPYLGIDITSNERPYKYTWYGHFFERDYTLCAYTEKDSMILFPIR